VLSCFVTEIVGAVITARATNAQIYMARVGVPGRTVPDQSERVAKALVSTAAVGPDEPSTPPASTLNRGEPAAPDAPEPATPGALASLGGSAPEQLLQQGQSERIHLAKLLRATKLAHEELGEKTSLWIGCSVAAWFEGAHNVSGTAAKVLALVLFEALSDIAKEAIYAASKIEVGHVRFTFHGPLFLTIALIGGAACGGVFNAVRAACMIGDDVVDALG
jgi:hypothetical protein